ncbi:MAG: DUF2806 domain-containing protein [Oscillospiraceae bacterium]|nr:DUF2806 domain-containing protein [Oscillospiraceae bacterium]
MDKLLMINGGLKVDSIVNLDGLSDVINNLIDKIALGVGWIANYKTPKRLALDTFVQDIQNSDLDPIEKAVCISNAKKIIKEHTNQSNIVDIAIQSLETTAKPSDIDDDWIAQFMDKARLVSTEEFQYIWGKVLAYECNHPNSMPKSVLSILERMDKEDAEVFTALASISICVSNKFAPVVVQFRLKEYKQWGITLESLFSLKSLGLIEVETGITNGYSLVSTSPLATVTYFDMEYKFHHTASVPVGNVVYTKAGMALCNLIEANKVEGFWEEFCLPIFKSYDVHEEKH